MAFAGLGLLLAGTLRAETVLALANVLFLAFLVVGGIIVPIDQLPAPLAAVAAALPAAPLVGAAPDRARGGAGGARVVSRSPARRLGGGAARRRRRATFRWE